MKLRGALGRFVSRLRDYFLVLSTKQPQEPLHSAVGEAVIDLVMDDIRARDQRAVRRQATRIRAFNGRDALRDAYEEAIDLVICLRQELAEREWQPEPPEADDPPKVLTIHVLHAGAPLCEFSRHLPRHWRPGDRWVRLGEHEATATVCAAAALRPSTSVETDARMEMCARCLATARAWDHGQA